MTERKNSPVRIKSRPRRGSVAFERYLAGARDPAAVNAAKKMNGLK